MGNTNTCDFNTIENKGHMIDNYIDTIKKTLSSRHIKLNNEIIKIDTEHKTIKSTNHKWIEDILSISSYQIDNTMTIIEWLEKNEKNIDQKLFNYIKELCIIYFEKQKKNDLNILHTYLELLNQLNITMTGKIDWNAIENDHDASIKYIKGYF